MEENGFFEAFDANGGRGIVNEERGEIKRAAESADSRRETFDQGLPLSLSLFPPSSRAKENEEHFPIFVCGYDVGLNPSPLSRIWNARYVTEL